jgi:hypothetical protein
LKPGGKVPPQEIQPTHIWSVRKCNIYLLN